MWRSWLEGKATRLHGNAAEYEHAFGDGGGLRAFEAEDLAALSAADLGASLDEERRAIDRLEADFSRRLGRFHATRGFVAGGPLDTIAWLKQPGRLSGGAAAERVKVASKLAELPVMAGPLPMARSALARRPYGMWIVDGRLDAEGGAYLSTALEAVLGPRSKDDHRTPGPAPG